jgi:hypothetical protein
MPGCYFAPNSRAGFGQHGVEQKAPIEHNYRGFILGAFRPLRLMLAAVLIYKQLQEKLLLCITKK